VEFVLRSYVDDGLEEGGLLGGMYRGQKTEDRGEERDMWVIEWSAVVDDEAIRWCSFSPHLSSQFRFLLCPSHQQSTSQ
jgi:hypothetical protein